MITERLDGGTARQAFAVQAEPAGRGPGGGRTALPRVLALALRWAASC